MSDMHLYDDYDGWDWEADLKEPILTIDDHRFLDQLRNDIERGMAAIFEDFFQRDVVATAGATVRISGYELRDMYDHAPGMAYFTIQSSVLVPLEPFLELAQIKQVAEEAFADYVRQAASECEHEGKFFPSRMAVFAADGRALAFYDCSTWITADAIPPAKWDETKATIQQMREQASEEARWDNFETAKRLRDEATKLDLTLQLCQQQAAA